MKQLPWILVVVLMVVVGLLLWQDRAVETTTTTTITEHTDTVRDDSPQAVGEEMAIRTDTVYLPILVNGEVDDDIAPNEDGTLQAPVEGRSDTLQKVPTATDSARVVIPITRRVYRTDSYRAVVSGYRPSLDSIETYNKERTERVTETKRERNKRWGLSLQLGGGWNGKGFSPYIGCGVSYTFICF